mgnify:CR=1 FL=1
MTDQIDTTPEAVIQHLDISHNHEAGLIPMSTQTMMRALPTRIEELDERAVSMGMGPTDDLVKRLWLHDMHPESVSRQAADRIEQLEAKLAEAVEALQRISFGSQNSMTTKDALGREARATLAEIKGEPS